MKRPTKAHCFFEQSGAFKRAFIELGIPAEDYDIQNNFGETDHIDDLFAEIVKAYDGEKSIFDDIKPDDLIFAFFPCIYFCNYADFNFRQLNNSMRKWPIAKIWDWKLNYSRKRQEFTEYALKMTAIVEIRGLRMIVENPWNEVNYTNYHWFNTPSLIDHNRRIRGDYFIKPTAFWFIGCKPCLGNQSLQAPKRKMRIVKHEGGEDVAKGSRKAGLCSEERSLISPEYARNFIRDFILGVPGNDIDFQGSLF